RRHDLLPGVDPLLHRLLLGFEGGGGRAHELGRKVGEAVRGGVAVPAARIRVLLPLRFLPLLRLLLHFGAPCACRIKTAGIRDRERREAENTLAPPPSAAAKPATQNTKTGPFYNTRKAREKRPAAASWLRIPKRETG